MKIMVRRVSTVAVIGLSVLFAPAAGAVEGKISSPSRAVAQSSPQPGLLASKRIELPRDVSLRLGKDAAARPSFTTKLPVGKKGARVMVQTVNVESGRVDAILGKSKFERGVLLQGPDKVLGISASGHLSMVVSEKEIVIAAQKGDALLGFDGKFKPLKEGAARVYRRASKTSVEKPLLPAPSLTSSAGLSVAMEGGVDIPVRTEGEGRVRLFVLDEAGRAVFAGGDVLPGQANVSLPRAGTFRVHARQLGPGGIESPMSEPVEVQVLGLAPGQTPPENGVFYLDRGERVRLAGTEGLEVRYGKSPEFYPAGASLGLSQRRATSVEFRHPQFPKQRARLRLAPRISNTKLFMGPAKATWPGAPLKLRVDVRNGAGRLLELGNHQKVTVTVNSRKMSLRWKKTKRGLVASLPAQKGPGPWVVRMSVEDRKGRTLARDFLEVAKR